MKAAKRHVEEINRLKEAVLKTKSEHLKRDYTKAIRKMRGELRRYCNYRGFVYSKVIVGDFSE